MSNPEDPSAPPAGVPPKGPIVLRIKLRFEDVATFVERFAPNIGRSGLFIRSRTPKTVGTEVRFELRLADDTPVVVGLGVVRWVKEYDPQRPRAVHGMGVEFSRVTRESREVLLRVLEHRKRVGLVDGPGGIPVPAPAAGPGEDDAETRVVRMPTAPGDGAAPGRDDQVTAIRQAPTRRLDGRRPTRPPTPRSPGPDDPPTVIAPALSAQIAAAAEVPAIERRFDAELPTRVAPALSAQIAAAAEQMQPEGVDSGPTLARPAPLPPREPRRLRPSAADLVARAASSAPPVSPGDEAMTIESLAAENLDVETTLRRARSLAGADPERELRMLLDRSAAPLPITIDDASARLAAMVGGSAVAARRARSGRISSPPPIVADGTQETRPARARRESAEVPEPPIEPPIEPPTPSPSPSPSPPPSPSPSPPPSPPPSPLPPPTPPPPPPPPPVEIPPVPRPETPPAAPPLEIPPPFSPPPVSPDSEPTATGEALDPLDADTRIDLGFDLSGLSRMATSDPGVETTVITPAPLVDVAAEDVASDDGDDPDDPDILVGVPLPRTRRDSPLPGVGSPAADPRARRETPRFLSDEEPTSLGPARRPERRSEPPPTPVAAVKSAAADMWDLAPARQTSSGSIDITELVAHLEEHAGEPHFGEPTRTRPDSDSDDRHALGADAMNADDMLHSGVERLDRTPSRGGPRRRLPDTHPPDLASFADPPDAMTDEVRASIAPRAARPTPVEQRLSTVDDIEAALDGLDLDGLDDAPAPRNRPGSHAPPVQHAHQPGGRPGRPRAPTDDEIEIDIDLDGLDD